MPSETYSGLERWQSSAGSGPVLRGRRVEGPGPLIHFLHGNGFCGGVYWPMLKKFLPDYGLFTHDIEGHGDSDAPSRYSGTGAIIRRIPQVMQDQGLMERPLIGMGHSFGGALTVAVAAKHPGLFKALVLLDPILLPTPAWWSMRFAGKIGRNPMSNGALRRRNAWASRDEVIERLRGRGIYQGWAPEALASFVDSATRDQGGQRVLCCPREIEAAIFAQPVYPWKALAKIDVPVLFLRGEQSYEFFPWTERVIRRVNPRVILKTLPGGHCFMQQNPQAAYEAVQTFLEGL